MKTEKEKIHLSKSEAVKLMQNSRGSFFTVTFKTITGIVRTINAKYKGMNELFGYVLVWDRKEKEIKNVNTRGILELAIDKKEYTTK